MDQNIQKRDYSNIRCAKCGKLLAKPDNDDGTYEIKCIRCGVINSIFKGLSDQIIVTDSEGTILYVNPIIEKVTGYELTEVLGKKPSLWVAKCLPSFIKWPSPQNFDTNLV